MLWYLFLEDAADCLLLSQHQLTLLQLALEVFYFGFGEDWQIACVVIYPSGYLALEGGLWGCSDHWHRLHDQATLRFALSSIFYRLLSHNHFDLSNLSLKSLCHFLHILQLSSQPTSFFPKLTNFLYQFSILQGSPLYLLISLFSPHISLPSQQSNFLINVYLMPLHLIHSSLILFHPLGLTQPSRISFIQLSHL